MTPHPVERTSRSGDRVVTTEAPNHRGDLMDHPGLNHHPDLIAAVQEEAVRRHGLLLKDWEATL